MDFLKIRHEIDLAEAKKKICFEESIANLQSRCKGFIKISGLPVYTEMISQIHPFKINQWDTISP